MLAPRKVRYRKRQKGRLKGKANRGNQVSFGEVGLKATSHGKISAQQIESARIAITRFIKRGGKVFIRIFPDRPITEKPAEVRQGKGKGNPVGWEAPVRPGRVLYEVAGVDVDTAREALRRAGHKLSVKTTVVTKEGF
jgi:large subunit ribosomal protein L16